MNYENDEDFQYGSYAFFIGAVGAFILLNDLLPPPDSGTIAIWNNKDIVLAALKVMLSLATGLVCFHFRNLVIFLFLLGATLMFVYLIFNQLLKTIIDI